MCEARNAPEVLEGITEKIYRRDWVVGDRM
jgi:hypothetical protein